MAIMGWARDMENVVIDFGLVLGGRAEDRLTVVQLQDQTIIAVTATVDFLFFSHGGQQRGTCRGQWPAPERL